MTATVINVLPTEDLLAFNEHVDAWVEDLDPSDRVQLELAELAAQIVWKLRRGDAVQTARLTAQIEKALSGETARLEAARLGERLFYNPQGPDALYGAGRYDHREPRISWSPVALDPDRPARLLTQLHENAAGCAFLLDEWHKLRSQLEAGQAWVAQDTFRAVRLLGCNPLDALSVQPIAQLFAASAAFAPSDRDPFAPLSCELDDSEYAEFVQRVKARWAGMHFDTPDDGRRMLLSIIDGAVEDLKARAAVHEQNSTRNAIRLANCLSFDESREGELLRRYELAGQRALSRALGDLLKLKRAERDQKPAAKGRTRGTIDITRETGACDGSQVSGGADSEGTDTLEETATRDARPEPPASPASEQPDRGCKAKSNDVLPDYETKCLDPTVVDETKSGDSPANFETKSHGLAADCETKCRDIEEAVGATRSDDSPADYETKSPGIEQAVDETKYDGARENGETKSPDPGARWEMSSPAVGIALEANKNGRDRNFETGSNPSRGSARQWASRAVGPSLARAVERRASRAERRMAKTLKRSVMREPRSREGAARRSDRLPAGNSGRRLEPSRALRRWEQEQELVTFGRSPLLKALPGPEYSQLLGGGGDQAGLGAGV